MLVHIPDCLVGVRDLRNLSHRLVGVPIDDVEHRAGFPVGGRVEVQLSVEDVRVRRVGDYVRVVGAGSPCHDDVGACISPVACREHAEGGQERVDG